MGVIITKIRSAFESRLPKGKYPGLTDEQLNFYQDITFFRKHDIKRAYHRFRELIPRSSNQVFTVPHAKVMQMPELKENPFAPRICQIFTQSDDAKMTFDDFVYMLSVFSDKAPRDIKAIYAFKLYDIRKIIFSSSSNYDFDGDGYLNRSDMALLIKTITRHQLDDDEVFEETDTDFDDRLTYSEFHQVVTRSPDFVSTFRMRF